MSGFYEAIQAMLPDHTNPTLYSADLSNPPEMADYPYAVLWGTQETELSGPDQYRPTLADKPTRAVLDVRITYAALNPESLRIVMRNVRQALKAGQPVVAGYRCHLSRPVSLMPVEVDRDISVGGLHPMFAVDEMRLTAHMTGDTNGNQ